MSTITFVLSPNTAKVQHILPVNKILYDDTTHSLFTAGRDGKVIQHPLGASEVDYQDEHSHQLHSDWCNDIVRLCPGKFLTVSNDFLVVLLEVNEAVSSHKIVASHSDYIKCVRPLSDTRFVTAGLDKRVKVWELQEERAELVYEVETDASIYAMDVVDDTIFVGTSKGTLVSIVDGKIAHSVVHGGNLRSICCVGKTCITGSSNGTIKIWDTNLALLGEHVLENSVWSLSASADRLYAGDSKGFIYQICDDSVTQICDASRHGGILSIANSPLGLVYSCGGNSNIYFLNDIPPICGGFALVQYSILNNRRYVVTSNTHGDIQLWDIVAFELLGEFKDETFDSVVKRYSTTEVLGHWCSCTVRAGNLFVTVGQRFHSCEVYGESFDRYTILNSVVPSEEERYCLGRVVLSSLFKRLVEYEVREDELFRASLVRRKDSNEPTPAGSGASTPVNHETPALSHGDIEGIKTKVKEKRRLSIFGTPAPASAPHETKAVPAGFLEQRSSSSGSIFSRKMKLFNKQVQIPEGPANGPCTGDAANAAVDTAADTAVDTAADTKATPVDSAPLSPTVDVEKLPTFVPRQESVDNYSNVIHEIQQEYGAAKSGFKLLKKMHDTKISKDTMTPVVQIKSDVVMLVSNSSSKVTYSTLLTRECSDSQQAIAQFKQLEEHLPGWLGRALLREKPQVSNVSKSHFIIQRYGGDESLPMIPFNCCKLTAPSMLKVKKVLVYTVDRFDQKTQEMKDKKNPEEWMELVCKGHVLKNDMTLGSVKTLIWKSQGDIVLEYRRIGGAGEVGEHESDRV